MTYKEFIQNIIDTRGQWNIPEGEYFEMHHIVPRCLGGEPKRPKKTEYHNNIIWLYPEEHYIAHKLLAEENPLNEKLVLAWRRSAYDKCNKFIPEERYSELKKLAIIFSDEHKKNISKNHADVSGDKNPMFGKGHLLSGENNGRYGKEVSESTRNKISTKRKLQITQNKKAAENIKKWRLKHKDEFSLAQSKAGSKPIRCVEYNITFNNIKSAKLWARENGFPIKYISLCANGKVKDTYKGLHWEFIDKKEYNKYSDI